MTEELKTVTISEDEYKELLDDSRFLRALEQEGVEDWEWYDAALYTYTEGE